MKWLKRLAPHWCCYQKLAESIGEHLDETITDWIECRTS